MSDLEPIQRSRLAEIGQLLNQARQEKGMTLEEVSGKTLIRATILKAIEEGDARPLPEPVYIRGFIRRFGDLVGLNGTELCDSFPWQPSGSVPLSFVSASTVTSSQSPAQSPEEELTPSLSEADQPSTEQPSVELAPVQESVTDQDLAAAQSGLGNASDSSISAVNADLAKADTALPEPPLTEAADASSGLDDGGGSSASMVSQEDRSQDEVAAITDAVPVVSELPAATSEAEAAYESRAALFGEDAEVEDAPESSVSETVTSASLGGAAAIAATTSSSVGMGQAKAPGDEGGERSTTGETSVKSATGTASVATLPSPPAPAVYREPEQRNPMPWILAVVATVVGLGIALLAFGGGNRQNPANNVAESSDPIEQSETSGTEPAPSEPVAPPVVEEVKATVPSDKVVLELEVKGSEAAWMDVFVDGTSQIEGIQPPGFKQRWEGSQEIDFATARPDVVWISVNGGESKPFGDAAALKQEIFKPTNAQ